MGKATMWAHGIQLQSVDWLKRRTVALHEYLHPGTSTIDRSVNTACLFLLL